MERKEFLKTLTFGVAFLGLAPANLFAKVTKLFDPIDEAACREVWKKLTRNRKHIFWRYVGPQEGLPNVFIYGDSISQDYTEDLRDELKNEATVFRIFTNGGDSSTIIKKMKTLQKSMFQPNLKGGWNFEWDVIQFNVGLHDLKYLDENRKYDLDNGVQVSSPKVYKENLQKAIEYFKKEHPKAKLIYALTTPVPAGSAGRKEGDAVVFNNAALEVLKMYPEITINDLYSFTKPHMNEWQRGKGNVHYKENGSAAQAKQVAKVIKSIL